MTRLLRIHLALAGALALAGCPEQNVEPGLDAGVAGADAAAVAPDAGAVVSSRAYKGHESDLDTNNFVNAYPAALGTRLDDCQTCHRGGTFTDSATSRKATKNACDFCHLVQHPMSGTFDEAQPASYAQTLNPYGAAYQAAGRTKEALTSMENASSAAWSSSSLPSVTLLWLHFFQMHHRVPDVEPRHFDCACLVTA